VVKESRQAIVVGAAVPAWRSGVARRLLEDVGECIDVPVALDSRRQGHFLGLGVTGVVGERYRVVVNELPEDGGTINVEDWVARQVQRIVPVARPLPDRIADVGHGPGNGRLLARV